MGEAAFLPDLWTAERAASELRERGVKITATTLTELRKDGKLGSIQVGARHYYTAEIIVEYLDQNRVSPCPRPARNVSTRSETTGFPSTPSDPTASGAEHGTIDLDARRAATALGRATFKRPKAG
jgi:hypothetical protein